MKRRLFLVMLIGLFPCIVFAGHLYAAERTYNVLFIQSYNHRTPWNDRLTEGVRDGLSRGGIKAKVTTEYQWMLITGLLHLSVSLCGVFVNGHVKKTRILLLQAVMRLFIH